jgi:hypothetical protein
MNRRVFYVASFTVLGGLVGFLLHGIIEIPTIFLLTRDFERYSFGLTWDYWFLIHHIGTTLLVAGGLLFGYRQGKYWWNVIDEKSSLSGSK